jgi:hypothetical protein
MTLKKMIGEEEHLPCDLRLDEEDVKSALVSWALNEGFIPDQRERVLLNIAVDDDAIVDEDERTVKAVIPVLPPRHSHYADKDVKECDVRKASMSEVAVRLWIAIVHHRGVQCDVNVIPSETEMTSEAVMAKLTTEGVDVSACTVTIKGPFFMNLSTVEQKHDPT